MFGHEMESIELTGKFYEAVRAGDAVGIQQAACNAKAEGMSKEEIRSALDDALNSANAGEDSGTQYHAFLDEVLTAKAA